MRGVSDAGVRNAIKDGRLRASVLVVDEEKGIRKIDSDLADKEWPGNNIRVDQRPGTAKTPAEDGDDSTSYYKARAKREEYNAELARLRFEEESGKLVNGENVRKQWVAIANLVRTKLLGIPSKCKQQIPDFTHDQYLTLERLVREALEDLAETIADEPEEPI